VFAIFFAVVGVIVVGAGVFFRWSTRVSLEPDRPEPDRVRKEARSTVRLLRSEAELMVAIDRATEAERRIAELAASRADRYERLRPCNVHLDASRNN